MIWKQTYKIRQASLGMLCKIEADYIISEDVTLWYINIYMILFSTKLLYPSYIFVLHEIIMF